VGDDVVVFEPEDGIEGLAQVQELDDTERFVYLDVNWSTFIEQPSEEQADRGRLFSNMTSNLETFGLKEIHGSASVSHSGSFARDLFWPQVHYVLFAPAASSAWTVLPRSGLTVMWSSGEAALLPPVTAYVDYGASEEGPQRDTSAFVRSI
jgi:hypothetical protein